MRILCEHADILVGAAWAPAPAPLLELPRRQRHIDRALGCIDGDAVAVAQQCERSTHCSLGRDMSNDEAMTATGETAVGDERDVCSQATPHEGAGRTEHLAHPWAPFGPFESDHHHISRAYRTFENGLGRALLTVEHSRAAREGQTFLPRDLCDGSLRSHIAV